MAANTLPPVLFAVLLFAAVAGLVAVRAIGLVAHELAAVLLAADDDDDAVLDDAGFFLAACFTKLFHVVRLAFNRASKRASSSNQPRLAF